MAKKILVPIDLRHESSWKAALPEAVRLATGAGDEIVLMTVIPEVVGGLDWRYSIRGETDGSPQLDIDAWLADAETRLEQIAREFILGDVPAEIVARYGTVYEEILDLAEELAVDQIVMAANRPSLADYLIGPNTARVVRHAKCSVQVVRG